MQTLSGNSSFTNVHKYFTNLNSKQHGPERVTFIGNVWIVISLLSVNKLINTYSVYNVRVAYITGRVTVYGPFIETLNLDELFIGVLIFTLQQCNQICLVGTDYISNNQQAHQPSILKLLYKYNL